MNQLETFWKARGIRLNSQYRILLDILDRSPNPLSAEEAWDRAVWQDKTITLPSVQKLVGRLEKLGLLLQITSGDRIVRYQMVPGALLDDLLLAKSGAIIVDLSAPTIEEVVRKTVEQLGYELLAYRLELYVEREFDDDDKK